MTLARSPNDKSCWWTFRLTTNIKFPCYLIARNEEASDDSRQSSTDGEDENEVEEDEDEDEDEADDNDDDGEDDDGGDDDDDGGYNRRHSNRYSDSDDYSERSHRRGHQTKSPVYPEDQVIADAEDTIVCV